MGTDFQIKLTAEGKKLVKELEELAKLEVAVGYQEGVSYPDGTSVVEVALYNELGTVHRTKEGTIEIPSRPFMRDSLNGHRQEIEQFMQQQAKAIVNGKRAEEILKEIGVFQKGLIQREITHGHFEGNTDSTKARKGSDKPLIDTGLMRQSVNFVVREKGSSD